MIKKFLIGFASLFILVFMSCSSDESSSEGTVADDEIWFVSSLPDIGSDLAMPSSMEIGVFMIDADRDSVIHENRKYRESSKKGEFIANKDQIFKKNDKSGKLQFVAYYPYSEHIVDNRYEINLSNQNDQQRLETILYGRSDIQEINTSTNAPVTLNFRKALAKLKFDITIGVGLSPADLKNLKAEMHGMNTTGKLDIDGSIVEKSDVAPIPLLIGDRGASAAITIFPGGESEKRSIIFKIADKQLTWNIPSDKVFDADKIHHMLVKLTDTKCYVWDTDENFEPLYEVGDYYPNSAEPQGIVYWIEPGSNGKHGKAFVSNFGHTVWGQSGGIFGSPNKFFGATSEDDGLANTQRIASISSREKSIQYCLSQGEGWYLPAIEELRFLYAQGQFVSQLPKGYCWSSTELDRRVSYVFDGISKAHYLLDKSKRQYVIPVCKF
jgi:hypothetical protein